MKRKALLSLILVFALLFTTCAPTAFAVSTASVSAAASAEASEDNGFVSFFRTIFDKLVSFWQRIMEFLGLRKAEEVSKTMNQNAIHMLKSVTDTICDSFIIATEDGKVIVIDGGMKTETDYFVQYLKGVTGRKKPHIDAWFLSHPHDDHCEVFLDVVENRADEVSFDKVYANFPDSPSFYEGYDEWAVTILTDYYRLLPKFADKAAQLHEGETFHIGAAEFTVFYTFNPEWKNCNEASAIMRMDLGGTSVMFTGDAGTNAGNYVVEQYGGSGLLDCDYCKMSHHGQSGVDKNFYEAVAPEVCLWPTPTWVYENTNGNLHTFETRAWVEELGVKKEYKSFEGSCVIGMKPRIVTTTDVFEDGYPAEQAIDRLARIGFEGIDMGLDYWMFDGSPFLGDDYLGWAESLRARADEVGIPYTHAHAPGEADAGDVIGRSIEVASTLGARYLVVHPVWRDENGEIIKNKKKFLQVNADNIEKWLPKAEECGVVLLSENVLWGASSDPRIIAELVKKVDSDWFGWCFDVGHAWCSGYQPSVLKQCAVTPMSLHIQDNDGSSDQHLIPGDGTIDMELFFQTLREVGYLGDCVLEAHHQSLVAPDEERDAILSRLLETAQPLRDTMR